MSFQKILCPIDFSTGSQSAMRTAVRIANDSDAEFVLVHALVVMGSRGRTGIRRALLGSVAEKIVRHAVCPALVARRHTPQGRTSHGEAS
jgi:nucleotide-binding universal stress UspA family protein